MSGADDMRWTPGANSSNIEDRRGARGGMRMGMAPMGIGGTVVLLVLSLIFGRDFVSGTSGTDVVQPQSASGEIGPVQQSPEEAKEVQFVTFVLDTAQATWAKLLPQTYGVPWHDAKLVLFRDATPTGCGTGQTAMGPFYCPEDEKVYIDLGFYDELKNQFGAPGDFAQAYVIAHELGHHVQHLLGTDQKVQAAEQSNPEAANQLSVRLELQADCYAGVWGYSAKQRNELDPGDAEEGLNAASSVGDDRIQQRETGRVNSDTFTHGTSQQRMQWFQRGFTTGDPRQCDTFSGSVAP
jgi:predicted metalloprotease